MAKHLVAALYFEDMAKQEHRPEERERLLVLARSFHWLAIADAKRLIEDSETAASGRGAMKRRRAYSGCHSRVAINCEQLKRLMRFAKQ